MADPLLRVSAQPAAPRCSGSVRVNKAVGLVFLQHLIIINRGASMNFRRFEPRGAAFCFKVRSNAFIQRFYGELTPVVEVAAGVNSYMPDDDIRMS